VHTLPDKNVKNFILFVSAVYLVTPCQLRTGANCFWACTISKKFLKEKESQKSFFIAPSFSSNSISHKITFSG
jgi:hypothetical protein